MSTSHPFSPMVADPVGFTGLSGLVASLLALVAWGDFETRPVVGLCLLAMAVLCFALAVLRIDAGIPTGWIIGVAIALRLIVLPLSPTLSDDLLRYAWDGKVISAGFNPYLLAPESPELTELRDSSWAKMPHHEVPTVYPPLALSLFAAAASLPKPLLGIKILLGFADLAACILLIRLAATLAVPRRRCLWYCWNPLVVIETTGMGHVDALMVSLTLAALVAMVSRPPLWTRAALAACGAVLAKLTVIVALPLWVLWCRSPKFLAVLALALIVAAAPVVVAVGGVPPGLVTYAVSWEFNGPLFEPLWRLIAATELADLFKAGLDEIKAATGNHAFWNRAYPLVYPQLLAKALLAVSFVSTVVVICLRAVMSAHRELYRSLAEDTGRILAAFLLCSATFYPWYLLWILPLAALARHWGWLVLSATIHFSYVPQLLGIEHYPWFFAAVWVPPLIAWRKSSWSFA